MLRHRQWINVRLATMVGGGLGTIEHGTLIEHNGLIVYAGAVSDAPNIAAAEIIDCAGRWVTPGLIDCHTHLVHAGNRAKEFEKRLAGASYEEIARAGGGIMSTVRATRAATHAQLLQSAMTRVDRLIAEGVTTIEIKSGYGLTVADEIKMLEVATALGEQRSIRVCRTLLAAHDVPPEFEERADDYIDLVCNEIIPQIAASGLADAVDGFCEGIGFSRPQIARVFEAARDHSLPVKLHAEQLSNSGGATLASEYRALSSDHLEYLDEAGVIAMSKADTVAVLLPGAYYFLREKKSPPVSLLRHYNVPIAVASDCNPGTSPMPSLLLAMNMAATLFGLTVDECLTGVTRIAAKALGLSDCVGTLEAGKRCDLAIWNVDYLAEIVYHIGFNPLYARVSQGKTTC